MNDHLTPSDTEQALNALSVTGKTLCYLDDRFCLAGCYRFLEYTGHRTNWYWPFAEMPPYNREVKVGLCGHDGILMGFENGMYLHIQGEGLLGGKMHVYENEDPDIYPPYMSRDRFDLEHFLKELMGQKLVGFLVHPSTHTNQNPCLPLCGMNYTDSLSSNPFHSLCARQYSKDTFVINDELELCFENGWSLTCGSDIDCFYLVLKDENGDIAYRHLNDTASCIWTECPLEPGIPDDEDHDETQ